MSVSVKAAEESNTEEVVPAVKSTSALQASDGVLLLKQKLMHLQQARLVVQQDLPRLS